MGLKFNSSKRYVK